MVLHGSGSDTLHLQIYPLASSGDDDSDKMSQAHSHDHSPAASDASTSARSAAKGPPLAHPSVHPQSQHLRYAAEVNFIRSLMDAQMSCAEWQMVVSAAAGGSGLRGETHQAGSAASA